jgi:hypothetical protein
MACLLSVTDELVEVVAMDAMALRDSRCLEPARENPLVDGALGDTDHGGCLTHRQPLGVWGRQVVASDGGCPAGATAAGFKGRQQALDHPLQPAVGG